MDRPHRARIALMAAACAAALGLAAPTTRADEVVLTNGDKLTGKIGNVAAGKMKFTSPALGDLTIDLAKVTSYTTDEPATVRLKAGGEVQGKVAGATPQSVPVEGKAPVPMADVKQINPPATKWTGSVVANGLLTRGNSNTEALGVSAEAVYRRDTLENNDRFTLKGAYNFGREENKATGDKSTTVDNFFAAAKYDRFLTDQLYAFGLVRYDHDRIADLNFRLSPGAGVGYQFFEGPTFNLSAEAGASFVYEDYASGGQDQHAALRLAYHVDKKLNDTLALFHNLEYLPAFENPGDYNLNADAGIRATLTKSFFTEFKLVYQRDSTPAPGAQKNDLRYLLGVGWAF